MQALRNHSPGAHLVGSSSGGDGRINFFGLFLGALFVSLCCSAHHFTLIIMRVVVCRVASIACLCFCLCLVAVCQ